MPQLSRRAFLTGAAGAGITLAACGGAGSGAGSLTPALRLPMVNALTWPVTAVNQPIGNGLAPEQGATLRVLSWPGYTSPAVLNYFAKVNQCSVELTAFSGPWDLLGKLASGTRYDAVLGTRVRMLVELVGRELIQPLNPRYLPDASAIWSVLQNPYYDLGARYTVPCGVYTTGLAWRKDKVAGSPYPMASGWDFAWQQRYRDRVAILGDYRQAIGLGLLRTGTANLNTADPLDLDTAQQALSELTGNGAAHVDSDPAASLAAGRTWIHQATSAQIAVLEDQPQGLPASAFGYWFPPAGFGPVACESAVIVRGAHHPVLAHRFLNSLLQPQNALANAGYNGRTPPLTVVTPSILIAEGVLTRDLISTVVLPETLRRGLIELPLPAAADGLWRRAWKEVSGMA